MRIGLFGGSFDPVHRAHLKLAAAARRTCRLSCVYFIPSKNPFKKNKKQSSMAGRVKLLQRALKGTRGFHVSLYEAARPGPSYTVNTVAHFKKHFPKDEF